jgi:hypothetical protein
MISLPKKAAAATAILATAVISAYAQEQIGQATLIRTSVIGQTGELAVRSPVFRDERINTSQNGLGEFRFADGTKFAIGGGSSVVVDRFIYDSSKTFDKLTLNAARGSFRWISGKSKSEAYEIQTPAGVIGIRGTRLDIYVGPNGLTSVVLLSGRARFCGSNGCRELRRSCDVVVATPAGGVSDAARVDRSIFQTVGSDRAFPFLSGRQRLSRGFQGFFGGSCGLSSSSNTRNERGGATDGRSNGRSAPSPSPGEGYGGGGDGGEGSEGGEGGGSVGD